jgi:Icc-related predicted phosphoesterase
VDQPQWGDALDQLKELKARQDQLNAEISVVEGGLKAAYALSDAYGSWISAGNQRFRVSSQSGRRTLNREQLRLELSAVLGEDDADELITKCESEGKPFDRLNISKINKRP